MYTLQVCTALKGLKTTLKSEQMVRLQNGQRILKLLGQGHHLGPWQRAHLERMTKIEKCETKQSNKINKFEHVQNHIITSI